MTAAGVRDAQKAVAMQRCYDAQRQRAPWPSCFWTSHQACTACLYNSPINKYYSFVRSFVRSLARSFVHSFIHRNNAPSPSRFEHRIVTSFHRHRRHRVWLRTRRSISAITVLPYAAVVTVLGHVGRGVERVDVTPRLAAAPIRVEVDVSHGPQHAERQRDASLAIRVDDVNENGVRLLQSCLGGVILEPRAGWVEACSNQATCLCRRWWTLKLVFIYGWSRQNYRNLFMVKAFHNRPLRHLVAHLDRFHHSHWSNSNGYDSTKACRTSRVFIPTPCHHWVTTVIIIKFLSSGTVDEQIRVIKAGLPVMRPSGRRFPANPHACAPRLCPTQMTSSRSASLSLTNNCTRRSISAPTTRVFAADCG